MVHRSTIHVFPFFNGSEFHRRVNSRQIKLFAVDKELHSHHHAHVDVELANPHEVTSVANRGVQVRQALLAVNRDYAFHVADALVAGASTSSQRKCCSDTDINSYGHARIRFY